jgi:hypothetical protein
MWLFKPDIVNFLYSAKAVFMKRLIPSNLIPISLWDEKIKLLRIPPDMVEIYRILISRNNLNQLANSRNPKNPPTGGLTQEKTDEHFAQAFDGSSARAQLALLDPKNELAEISNDIIVILSGNKVSLTDAPCGAGAAAFALLANIAELRRNEVLPRMPLDIFMVGAEISEPARKYAQDILVELRPKLEAQAIFVEAIFREWDVTCSLSNTDLIQCVTQRVMDYNKRLLIIANFNGFLEKERKRKDAEKQIEELFRHLSSTDNSMAIWIEPNMNRATESLFPWIFKKVKEFWSRFVIIKLESKLEPMPLNTSTEFRLPLSDSNKSSVRLSIIPINLIRSRK